MFFRVQIYLLELVEERVEERSLLQTSLCIWWRLTTGSYKHRFLF